MPVGKHSSSEVTITLTDAPGGTQRTITSFVLTMGAVKLTSVLQVSTAYGDTFEKHLATGMSKVDPITLSGLWDDSGVTAPHAVFIQPDIVPSVATARVLVVTFSTGTVRTFTVSVLLVSFEVLSKQMALTEFIAVLQPTGAGVWS